MYVLLGSNGNITSKATALLLERGAAVRVVGRSLSSLESSRAAGAVVAAGDIGDVRFLTAAFEGATAVYTMIPSDPTAPDMPDAQDRLGTAITQSIVAAGVKRVVSLSSIGAHVPAGTGPIAGLYRQEQRLNALAGVDVVHLRPGYFFENHLHAIGMIHALGIYTDMTAPDARLPMVASNDIARTLARELCSDFQPGKRVLHLRAATLYTMRESTALLGKSIGKTDLQYLQASPEEGRAALRQQGFSASAAAQFEEMSAAFSNGLINGGHERGPTETAPTTLEQFSMSVFSAAYSASIARSEGECEPVA